MSDESLQKKKKKNDEDFDKKKNRGRPHKRWLDLIKENTGLPIATAGRHAKDKYRWRKNVNIRWAKPLSGVRN